MCSSYRSNHLNMLMLVVVVVLSAAIHSATSVGAVPDCHQSERLALLSFKHDLIDPSDRLSSWVPGRSCCNWHGVVCDNLTGHVLELHLRGPVSEVVDYYEETPDGSLGGKINNSLLDLKYLRHLDLSSNDFSGIQIPLFVGSMQSLTYINLSDAGFGGEIPSHLGNLSNLLFLGLGTTFSNKYGIRTKNLGWLSGLAMIRHLDLSYATLPETSDALQGINALPLLEELHLPGYRLDHVLRLSLLNFSNLVIIDLSWNRFSSFPVGLENLTSLKYLDLSGCQIDSMLPKWLYKFGQLEQLRLPNNALKGMIADDIANLTNLNRLDLSYNALEGKIPSSLRTMCKLEWLDLSGLGMAGKVSEVLRSLSGCASSRLHHISFSECLLDGPLSFEIGQFQNLGQLYLSGNAISGQIPDSLGSLNSLTELRLLHNQLNGTLPQTIGKLHRLEQLVLSFNSISGPIPDFLGSVTSLLDLDLHSNQFTGTIPRMLGQLHRLQYLSLSYNSFSGPVPDSFGSLYSLFELDMDNNQISGPIPDSFGSLSSLLKVDLSNNQLNGTLPPTIGQLHRLYFLNLHNNSISGAIPDSMGSLTSLRQLDLSRNNLCGVLPASLGQLIQLDTLEVSFNSLEGLLSPVFFANLTSLRVLGASGNRIRMEVNRDWILPSQLEEVHLSSWYLGPRFPKWLSFRGSLSILDISDAGISDTIPSWFWNTVRGISFLNLSHNHLHGTIHPSLFTWKAYATIDLSSNSFTGSLPRLSSGVMTLDLSNNSFFGPISSFLCDGKSEVKSLWVLHLGNNNLSGKVPDCWTSWPSLSSIELQNNNLFGSLPESLGSLSELQYLHLRNNSLSGVLPLSLQNCTKMVIFDIAENKLGGRVPRWIGQRFSDIRILSLRSNSFDGFAPDELCSLSLLIILDLANNNLSGAIPNCLANFSAMAQLSIPDFTTLNYVNSSLQTSLTTYEENAILVTKALVLEYTKNLRFMTAIDLSNNSLSGPIPTGITKLVALKSLNLSGNSLTKKIPDNMGNMLALESLDISLNRLSGEIPRTMASITFLGFLNLSFNNLTGRIPTSTQLQGFDASSYAGNQLCGPPVSPNCGPDGSLPRKQEGDDQRHHGIEYDELYVSMSIGFVVGLGAVVAPLLYSRWWRLQYFQWLQSTWDRLWVWTVLMFRT